MTVTLGGDRLGSGNKQDLELHNYYRSTHDLSQKWASSMQCGTLYPFIVIPVMRGDTFEIDLNAAARTIPTKGPLFGSFKMQTDIFFAPARLYQGILHNNPLAIGLKMNQVLFPQMECFGNNKTSGSMKDAIEGGRISNSCLLKYLGLSGYGHFTYNGGSGQTRNINAIPMLAYYDIFKNYYANKQEEKAYVLGKTIKNLDEVDIDSVVNQNNTDTLLIYESDRPSKEKYVEFETDDVADSTIIELTPDGNNEEQINKIKESIVLFLKLNDIWQPFPQTASIYDVTYSENKILVEIINNTNVYDTRIYWNNAKAVKEEKLDIVPFNLSNIDDMRMNLLSHHTLGQAYIISAKSNEATDHEERLPYSQVTAYNAQKESLNKQALNGLMLKTYQADMFNAWVNTDWIEGENGIAEITKIAVTDGSVYIDSINLAEKLYNMLNRVAVSGGTYEDWQDAVYTDSPRRQIESPVYLGGMSSEVVFEEIIQTAPVGESPLGTLGGRGTLLKRKGGNIDCKIDEAGFIIGIVSLTPRIFYTQGNEFYLTDLKSMDDLHKPALDGIGFQDLIGERLAWWDTKITGSTVIYRSKIGKLPAWMEYMTAVDKAYGDFAEPNGDGFMILQRNYEVSEQGKIKDATTYIDPTKYNYAFAYAALDSQNFWVEIDSKITARRYMSAKQIPNI